jgi:predicted esterase
MSDLTNAHLRPKKITKSIVIVLILGCVSTSSSQQSGYMHSRCTTPSTVGLNATANPTEWPKIIPNSWLYVRGFSEIFYNSSESPIPGWGKYRDWMCGYIYGVRVPPSYSDSEKEYPLVVFLHGGLTNGPGGQNPLSRAFHIPDADPYILLIPSKLEWDWNPKKVLDIIYDVKSKLRVDAERVYLTGLSMGGRGTFIVAAAIPQEFAAIMPLSPHHQPYSYVHLAPNISTLPIWMSHGDADQVSSYDMAIQMKDKLQEIGANVTFNSIEDGKHCCWNRIYENPQAIEWLLNQRRTDYDTVMHQKAWGQIKNIYKTAK